MEQLGRQQGDIRWYQFHRWLNPFRSEYLVLWTPFTPEEIECELHPFMFRQARKHDPGPIFKGRFDPAGFALHLWKKPMPEMHIRTWLVARYEPLREGTNLHVSFGSTRRSARIATAIILTSIVCAVVLGTAAILTYGVFYGLIAFSSALTVVAFGIGRWHHRHDLDFYARFLTLVLTVHRPDQSAQAQHQANQFQPLHREAR